MRRLALLCIASLLAVAAMAIDDLGALEDPALQARYEKLSDELRCLVCQNQSIADSTAELAGDLRRQVRAMLTDGASDAQILEYMTARYGDFVRYRPGFNRRTYLLWAGPVILLVAGLAIAGLVIVRRAGQTEESAPR